MRIKERLVFGLLLLVLGTLSVHAEMVFDSTASDFNAGTFQNTFYNLSGFVQLNASQTTGNFTSRVFDALVNATWNNISWTTRVCYGCQLLDNRGTESGFAHNVNMTGNVFLLHLNNTSGENATFFKDSSGSGINGTCVTNRCPAFSTGGKFGGASDFENGGSNDDVINFSNPSALNNFNSEITLETWLKPESYNNANDAPTFIDRDFARQYSYYFVRLSQTTAFQQVDLVTSSGSGRLSGLAITNAGQWYHLVFTYNGSEMRVYQNGILDGTINHNGTINASTKDFLIGSGWSGTNPYFYPFDGVIDEVAVYNRSLNEQEVSDHYERGVLRLNLTARSCDDAVCSGEIFFDVNDSSPQQLALNMNRYFQYSAVFGTDNSSYSPSLYNTTVEYTASNSAPRLNITAPLNQSYDVANLHLNYSAIDAEGNLDSCWYSVNDGAINTTIACGTNVSLIALEGSNNWAVFANDTAGEINSSSVTFFVDSLYPSIAFGAGTLSNGSYRALNSLYANVSWNESNFASISFILYNSTGIINQTVFNIAQNDINWTGLSDGVYFYEVSINDSLGHMNMTERRTISIDTISPGISFVSPSDANWGAVTRNFILVNVSANDANFVNLTLDFYNSAGLVNQTTSLASSVFSNYSGLSDGNYSFNATVFDLAGNANRTETRTIWVDATFPVIDINAPQNSTYNSLPIVFNVSVNEDAAFCNYSLNGATNVSMSTTDFRVFAATNASMADDGYNLHYYCGDLAGNINSTSVAFGLDSVVPAVSVSYPLNASYTVAPSVLNYSATDNAIQSCWYTLNEGVTNTSVACGMNVSGLSASQGSNIWRVYANDSAGNTNSSSVTFSFEGSAPSLEFVAPTESDWANISSAQVRVNVSASDSNLESIVVRLYNSSGLVNSTIFSSSPADILFVNLGDGSYYFNASANDAAGNINSTETRTVTLDSTPPLVTIYSPQNTTYYNATILVNISSNGASNVWFYNGSANETYTGAGYRTFAEGSTRLIAYANDSMGNINSTSVTFAVQLVNNTAPSVVLNAPASGAVIRLNDSLFASVVLNASVSDTDGNNITVWFYGDNALLTSFNATAAGTFTHNWTGLLAGNHSWSVAAFDGYVNGSSAGNFSVNISVDAPLISIISPVMCSVFGTNESLFISVEVNSSLLDSCWYSLDSGILNISLADCQTANFDVPQSGSYILDVYANESVNGNAGHSTVGFNVDIDAPTIIVDSPLNGTYTNQTPLTFGFFTESYNGQQTQHCSLLGDFTGSYGLNQTNSSISSGDTNYFSLNLAEGRYAWALACGNAIKNTTLACNYSIVSDVTPPNITINEPNGTYTNNSILVNASVIDNLANMSNQGLCTYNVSLVSGTQVVNATILASCASSALTALDDGNYQLVLAASDAAGNTQTSASQFSVSSSESSSPGGGDGGSAGAGTPGLTGFTRLNVTAPNPFYIKRGQEDTFDVRVMNSGQRFLNKCYLRFSGDFARYLNASGESSLSSGQGYAFNVGIELASDVVPGQYGVQGSVVCSDYSSQFSLTIIVTPTEFDFRFGSYERDKDVLRVNYRLEELVGRRQTISMVYELVNLDSVSVAEGREEVMLEANAEQDGVLEIQLPKDAFGEFNLLLTLGNGRESLGVERQLFLSSAGLTGLVISDENRRVLTWLVVVLLIAAIFVFAIRYVYNHYQLAHYHPPRRTMHHHLSSHKRHRGGHHAS